MFKSVQLFLRCCKGKNSHGAANCRVFATSGQTRSTGTLLSTDLKFLGCVLRRLRLKCDGTRAETRFRLSAKWTSPFKLAGASVQSTTGSQGVCISGSNTGYTMFRSSVKSTGYPLHSPVSPSIPLSCIAVCHHVSTGLGTLPLHEIHEMSIACRSIGLRVLIAVCM